MIPPEEQESDVSLEQMIELHQAYMRIPELVLRDLFNFIRPDAPSFVSQDRGGRQTAFNEGERTVWLHIEMRRKDLGERIKFLQATELAMKEPPNET